MLCVPGAIASGSYRASHIHSIKLRDVSPHVSERGSIPVVLDEPDLRQMMIYASLTREAKATR